MAKGSIRIARRYAKALLSLYEPSKLETVRQGLFEIARIWSEDESLQSALLNPANSNADRRKVLVAIADKVMPGDKHFANFLPLLLEAGRIGSISLVAEAFSQMIDELKNLLSLKVTSASKISSDEVNSFNASLEKEFGSLASVEWLVDEELIGGMRVRAGDRLLDGSVRGALERLQASLLGA